MINQCCCEMSVYSLSEVSIAAMVCIQIFFPFSLHFLGLCTSSEDIFQDSTQFSKNPVSAVRSITKCFVNLKFNHT